MLDDLEGGDDDLDDLLAEIDNFAKPSNNKPRIP